MRTGEKRDGGKISSRKSDLENKEILLGIINQQV